MFPPVPSSKPLRSPSRKLAPLLSLFFCLFAVLLASPALAGTPFSTEPQAEWLREVMPQASRFGDKTEGSEGKPPVIPAYGIDAQGGERLLGYVFFSADLPPLEKGYSAPIDMLVGLHVDGYISGLKVLNYVESYLYSRGDFLASEGFQEQFDGKPITDNFRLRHDLDAVSNATISSWAIARHVRNASRTVAKAYLGFVEQATPEQSWNANALEQLRQLSWQELLDQGLVVQASIPAPVDGELELSIAYMGRPALGKLLIGDQAYEAAERDASIRFDTREMVMIAVGGSASALFRQERLSIQQGESAPRRIHPRRMISAGNADTAALAGHAAYAGAMVMDEDFDPTLPFAIHYQALGMAEPLVLNYEATGLVLALASNEPIFSLAEIEKARLADADFLTRLRAGALWPQLDWQNMPWGETPWEDVALLLLTLGLVMTAFLRKSSRLRWAALAMSLVYLGFVDGGFLSVSHITGALMQGPGIFLNNLTVLIIVVFTLVTTLLWGRIFCSSLCPFGALQDFITRHISSRLPRRWRVRVPAAIHDRALYLKYALLALIVLAAVFYSGVSIFQYFEPFGTLFFFSSSLLLWSILLLFLTGCIFIPRFYCRYACPLGAALGLASLLSPLRISRVPQCTLCKVCEQACPTGAIRNEVIDFKECVRCDICEIKLIEKAGSCRHSVEEIARRRGTDTIRIVDAAPPSGHTVS